MSLVSHIERNSYETIAPQYYFTLPLALWSDEPLLQTGSNNENDKDKVELITAKIFVGSVCAVELSVAFEMNVDTSAIVTAKLRRRTGPHLARTINRRI